MIDPLPVVVIACCMALLFAVAGAGKLRDQAAFRSVLGNYQLVPDALLAPAARALPAAELVLACAWMMQLALPATAGASAVLLLLYAGGMGVNLARGRADIDCGCSPGAGSRLSWWLVARNVMLALLALMTALPDTGRSFHGADIAVAGLAIIASVLLYLATEQLVVNATRFRRRMGRIA